MMSWWQYGSQNVFKVHLDHQKQFKGALYITLKLILGILESSLKIYKNEPIMPFFKKKSMQ